MDASCKSLIAPGLVDSLLKLQLLLLFYRHPRWCGDTWHLSEWIREGPWMIEEAVNDLVTAGLLGRVDQPGRARYHLKPGLETWATLVQFVRCYDDPLRRDQIYTCVREADREQQFRAITAGTGWQTQVVW